MHNITASANALQQNDSLTEYSARETERFNRLSDPIIEVAKSFIVT